MAPRNSHRPPGKPSYPLAAAKSVRERKVDDCAAELSVARTNAERARNTLARAAAAHSVAAEELDAADRAARERLAGGAERAVDLAWAASHRRAELARAEHLAVIAEQAGRHAVSHEKAEHAARAALGTAAAELSAIERHEAEFRAKLARRVEENEEEAALERWNVKHSGSR